LPVAALPVAAGSALPGLPALALAVAGTALSGIAAAAAITVVAALPVSASLALFAVAGALPVSVAAAAGFCINVDAGEVSDQSTDQVNSTFESEVLDNPAERRRVCSYCKEFGHNRKTCNRRRHAKRRTEDSSVPSENVANVDTVPGVNDVNDDGIGFIDDPQVIDVPVVNNVPQENDRTDVGSPAAVDPIEYCTHCHRQPTNHYSIELNELPFIPSQRVYGDKTCKINDMVCQLCLIYLNPANKRTEWTNGWPSFIYSVLCERKDNQVINSDEFVRLVPPEIRRTYDICVQTHGHARVRACWNIPSYFDDYTHIITEFEKVIENAQLGPVFNIVDSTAYPTIRCPMGCYLYVECLDYELLGFIPFQHYFAATVCSKITSFGMNASRVKGFRPDWPVRGSQCEIEKFWVRPALYVHKTKGLCIITCPKSVHATESCEFLHPPPHPVLRNACSDFPDPLATVTLNPTIVRQGTSNKNTTSYDVCKLRGTEAGVASCHIGLEQNVSDIHESDTESIAMGLTLTERPDIFVSNANNEQLPDKFLEYKLGFYNKNLTQDVEERIQECKEGGTFISIHDNLLLCKGQHERHSAGILNKIKCPIVAVHPANSEGQYPIVVPTYKRLSKISLSVNAVLGTIANCRPMYSSFLREMQTSESVAFTDVHSHLLKLTTYIHSNDALRKKTINMTRKTKKYEKYEKYEKYD
jgi:hypothetical protein